MPTSIEAHRLFTASPVACDCHADRGQPVPRFAAEALPSIPPVPPQPPPDIDPLTWLAVVQAAVTAMTQAAERLEQARKPMRRRDRPARGNLCSCCAVRLEGTGFRARTMFVVQDINGNVRCATLTEKHAVTIATDKSQDERKDFVILTLPGYIASPKHATREVLIRAGRR